MPGDFRRHGPRPSATVDRRMAMRELFFKLLPYAMGVVLGCLLAFSPPQFQALGPWRFAVLGALLLVGLLAAVGLQLAATFPRHPSIEPAPDEPQPAEVDALVRSFRSLGFELYEPALRIDLRPTATLWLLRSSDRRCWASVFATGTLPRRVSYDVVSVIDESRGLLGSAVHVNAAILPLPPGYFKQVFPGEEPAQLLERHARSVRHLEERGIRFAAPSPDAIEADLRRDLLAQRRAVLANPLGSAWLALWRVATRTTPYLGSVERQRGVEETVQEVLSGRSAQALAAG